MDSMEYTEVNLDNIFRKWAKAMHGKKGQFDYRLNLEKVKFQDSRPEFTTTGEPQSMPTTQVIFEDTFRNDTTRVQKHRIRCVKMTASHAQVDLHQAIVCEERTRLQLSALPELIAHKSGFLGELEIEKIKSHDFKEKLTWEIDDEIEVPERKIVKAEVIVSEEKHKAEFVVKTKIRGNVHCDVHDASTGNYIKSLDGNVKAILEEYASSVRGHEQMSMWDFTEKDGVSFTSKGVCQFRYSVNKMVTVKEMTQQGRVNPF